MTPQKMVPWVPGVAFAGNPRAMPQVVDAIPVADMVRATWCPECHLPGNAPNATSCVFCGVGKLRHVLMIDDPEAGA